MIFVQTGVPTSKEDNLNFKALLKSGKNLFVKAIYVLSLVPLYIYCYGAGVARSVYAAGCTIRSSIRGMEQKIFVRNVQTGSRAHPSLYSVGTRVLFLWGKAAVHEADHSPPSSA